MDTNVQAYTIGYVEESPQEQDEELALRANPSSQSHGPFHHTNVGREHQDERKVSWGFMKGLHKLQNIPAPWNN